MKKFEHCSNCMSSYNPSEDNSFIIKHTSFLPPPNIAVTPPIHRHPFYEIIFVTQGEGVMQIDFNNYPIQKGSLFLFNPAQIHFPSVNKEFRCFLLRFDLSVFSEKQFFDNILIFNFDYLKVEEPHYAAIEQLLTLLKEEFLAHKVLKQSAMNNLLKLVLIKIQRLLPEVASSTIETSLFSSLNQLIEKNNYQITNPSHYAKLLKVPIKVLNNAVKEFVGIPCGEYIRSKTLVEAKRLLLYTTKNSNEIAYELGFMDTAYFGRFFKRETGISPITFRKVSLEA